jgi:hypothetical protein
MKVLIACEFSGIVREAFKKRGHDAWSCDLLPTEIPGQHIQDDVFNHLKDGWDMMLFFYPCTNMCVSGARWFYKKHDVQKRDINNFIRLSECAIPKTAGENPVGVLSTMFRKPDQIIQPWQFGNPESKATCLWLKGLPVLRETNNVYNAMMQLPKRERERVHHEPPGINRVKNRSRTYGGIASAMAEQWG